MVKARRPAASQLLARPSTITEPKDRDRPKARASPGWILPAVIGHAVRYGVHRCDLFKRMGQGQDLPVVGSLPEGLLEPQALGEGAGGIAPPGSYSLVARVHDARQGLELVIGRRGGQGPFPGRGALPPRVAGCPV